MHPSCCLSFNISWAEVGHSTLLYTAMSAMRYEVTVHTHMHKITLQGREGSSHSHCHSLPHILDCSPNQDRQLAWCSLVLVARTGCTLIARQSCSFHKLGKVLAVRKDRGVGSEKTEPEHGQSPGLVPAPEEPRPRPC